MRLRTREPETPDVIITPLIDVVFLLLIFFMVSTTFQRDSELTIELPEASTELSEAREDVVEVSVDVQGRYYVNGVQLVNTQPRTVKQAMLEAAKGRKAPPIVVSADAKTPHQAVITVMDSARQLGFVNLTFATRLVEEKGP